jgi:phage terminase small subunit
MPDKQLTTKQQAFLDNLPACNGDTKAAAELAGYAEGTHYAVVKALKTEILDMATNIMALNAPKAASKLVEIMDSAEPIPQANMRIQAAQQLLDRVGLGKTERLDVNVNSGGGLFVIPAKKEVIIDGEYTENE